MITQRTNVNLIPGRVNPRINVSQYDKGSRTLQFVLYNGDAAYSITSGTTALIQGTKPDGRGFQLSATVTTGSNLVTANLTEQMAIVAGDVICELVLLKGSEKLATANFVLAVEPTALKDTAVTSDSELPIILALATEQMEAAAASATLAQSYAKGGTGTRTGENTDNAKYYKEQAASSASSASSSATTATNKAANAASSATLAESYAKGGTGTRSGENTDNAKYYKEQAGSSASTATTKASEANTSATNAANSATASAESATASAGSATTASTQALKAEGYAVGTQNGTAVSSGTYYHNNAKYYSDQAGSSASNASTAATNAATSASNAASSAESAAGSASTTTTKATEASTSASNAAASAESASGSATSASGSASTASTKASEASTSASNAATSASNAAESASGASTSATAAAGSATAAAASAQDSEAWAVGQRGGVDVPASDETYENNSKYYAGVTEENKTAILAAYQEVIAFKNIIELLFETIYLTTEAGDHLITEDGDSLIVEY